MANRPEVGQHCIKKDFRILKTRKVKCSKVTHHMLVSEQINDILNESVQSVPVHLDHHTVPQL